MIWAVQMSTVEFHPWNSRARRHREARRVAHRPRPDARRRVRRVRRVADVVHEVLDELGAVGFPKTSGGKGLHVYVRIAPDLGFREVRRAALAVRARGRAAGAGAGDDGVVAQGPRARHGLRRLQPERPRPHHRLRLLGARRRRSAIVSAPVRWDEIPDVEPDDFTIATMPARFAELGDLHAGIDDAVSTSRRCWSGPTATTPRSRRPPEVEVDPQNGVPFQGTEGAASSRASRPAAPGVPSSSRPARASTRGSTPPSTSDASEVTGSIDVGLVAGGCDGGGEPVVRVEAPPTRR